MRTRRIAARVGWIAAPFAIGLLAAAYVVGFSWSGWAYAAGSALVAAGLMSAPRRVARHRGIARAGVGVIALTAALRLWLGAHGRTVRAEVFATREPAVAATIAPASASAIGDAARDARGDGARDTRGDVRGDGARGAKGAAGMASRVIARLIDEADIAGTGAHVIAALGRAPEAEKDDLARWTKTAYARMREAEGDVPSAVLPGLVGLEDGETYDAIVVQDGSEGRSARAFVFLHGFGGDFTLPCWAFAQAVARSDATTICPAVGWRGDWGNAAGEAVVRRTIAALGARGFREIYLAGIADGAAAASILAPKLRPAIRGVVLVSGVDGAAAAPGVPVLVVQGRADAVTPAATARAYARRVGGHYVEIEGGHFVMLSHPGDVERAISAWARAPAATPSSARR